MSAQTPRWAREAPAGAEVRAGDGGAARAADAVPAPPAGPAPAGGPGAPAELSPARVLRPADLEGFARLHGTAYVRYAHLMLGRRELADQAVDVVLEVLAEHWDHVRCQDAPPEAYGWAVLQQAIDDRLAAMGRGPALTETAAFAAVMRRAQPLFAELESGIGLYRSISRLPGRQFEVIVLRYVLGYSVARTALIMGVTEGTVRSNVRWAKRRLAQKLGIDYQPYGNEED